MNLKIYKNKADFSGVYLKDHIVLEKIKTDKKLSYNKEQPSLLPVD